VQDLFECRRVIAGSLCGLLGHLLEPDHFVCPATGQFAQLGDTGDVVAETGVHQPIAHPGGRQKKAGQLAFAQLATALPIRLRINVSGQSQDGGAVVAHREAQLRIETRVEVGEGLGIGFVERVLKPAAVPRRQPAAVHVLVDQRDLGEVLCQ
jgi:hypothetical protein